MKIFLQLVKEFWIPFILAGLWTALDVYAGSKITTWPIAVATFFSAFFLLSWAISQLFRIRKQHSVDSGLNDIQKKLIDLVDRLEDKTKEMIGVMTGGDSICYLTGNMGTQSFPNQLDPVWVVHHGRYPLYGVHIRICDVDKLNALISNRTMWDEVVAQSEQHATVEVLVPGHATDLHVVLPFDPNDIAKNFNIFFTARNGSFSQLLRFKKVNTTWFMATKVEMGKVMYEEVQVGYPRNASGQVDW